MAKFMGQFDGHSCAGQCSPDVSPSPVDTGVSVAALSCRGTASLMAWCDRYLRIGSAR